MKTSCRLCALDVFEGRDMPLAAVGSWILGQVQEHGLQVILDTMCEAHRGAHNHAALKERERRERAAS